MCEFDKNRLLLLTILILVSLINNSQCSCHHTFMTFCSNLSDVTENYEARKWTDIVIGDENQKSPQLVIDWTSIPLDEFNVLKTLIIINQISELKKDSFTTDPDTSQLEHLKLYRNNLRRMKHGSFDSFDVHRLSLVANNIEYVHRGAFYNCQIKILDLSDNNIEMIESEVFNDDLALGNFTTEMNFKNNKIELIEIGSLPASLEILNLSHNNLRTLTLTIFQNLINLKELNLGYNKLTSLPSLKTLTEVTVLDFSHNNMRSLYGYEFDTLTNLAILDMSYNELTVANMLDRFKLPKKNPAMQISLAFNLLVNLNFDGNENLKHHIYFLYGNPWSCKCWQCMDKFLYDNKFKRNKCDLEFFGNGGTPSCIYYEKSNPDCTRNSTANYYRKPFTDEELKHFTDAIDAAKYFKCSLEPQLL